MTFSSLPEYTNRLASVHETGRPWIIGKAAMSLNGKMTRPEGESQWISSEASRYDVQCLRAHCDAILIGGETARQDNPSLTVRELDIPQQPWRIIVTRSENLPNHLHLLSDEYKERTLIMAGLSWKEVWQQLFAKGIRTLLVEGGGNVLNQLAKEKWIDESIIYYAPFNLEGNQLVTAENFRHLDFIESKTIPLEKDLKISGILFR